MTPVELLLPEEIGHALKRSAKITTNHTEHIPYYRNRMAALTAVNSRRIHDELSFCIRRRPKVGGEPERHFRPTLPANPAR